MADRFIGEFKAKSLFIELFCTLEIFEIEFDASQPQISAWISSEISSGPAYRRSIARASRNRLNDPLRE
jgi:hypothetical protein